MAQEWEISNGLCQALLTKDFRMRPVPATFVPHLLTQEQNKNCLPVALTCLNVQKPMRTSHKISQQVKYGSMVMIPKLSTKSSQ